MDVEIYSVKGRLTKLELVCVLHGVPLYNAKVLSGASFEPFEAVPETDIHFLGAVGSSGRSNDRAAEWLFAEEYGQLVTHKCSLCGQTMTTVGGNLMDFCPNCGATMKGQGVR